MIADQSVFDNRRKNLQLWSATDSLECWLFAL